MKMHGTRQGARACLDLCIETLTSQDLEPTIRDHRSVVDKSGKSGSRDAVVQELRTRK